MSMVREAGALDIKTDVLIIGAGLAGLSTALSLPKSLKIAVLSKAALIECSSHYAQGGIAASLAKDDSVQDHIADTLIAGAGLCASDNTSHILSKGKQAVQWLCAQGVPFTQNDPLTNTNLTTADLHLTKEGGHGCRRVAHADDATGRHIMQALMLQAKLAPNITILPYHEALTLLTNTIAIDPENMLDNIFASTQKSNNLKYSNLETAQTQCQGAVVFDHTSQRSLTIHSRAVVMASGGLGQLFARASAPNVCVGDGIMMAWQAGCRLANLEFVQFHPTGLAVADSSFLVSEALRGEGGRLYCPATGKRFMLDIDERAELAPRDIVARAIAAQIENNGLGFVHLDVSHLPTLFIKQHFPQIYDTLLTLGIDVTTSPIPVAPTAHYSCGGIITCTNGSTDVQGLYAAGEVAYTGLHGANRLASNSLLECVVVGRNIAAHLPSYLIHNLWTPPKIEDAKLISLPIYSSPYNYKKSIFKRDSAQATPVNEIKLQLKALMTSHLGITRHSKSLEQALEQIMEWQRTLESTAFDTWESKNLALINAETLTTLNSSATLSSLEQWQLLRQCQLATLIVQSAYQRCESRGGHYRQDYPDLATKPQVSVIEPIRNNAMVNEHLGYDMANNDWSRATAVI